MRPSARSRIYRRQRHLGVKWHRAGLLARACVPILVPALPSPFPDIDLARTMADASRRIIGDCSSVRAMARRKGEDTLDRKRRRMPFTAKIKREDPFCSADQREIYAMCRRIAGAAEHWRRRLCLHHVLYDRREPAVATMTPCRRAFSRPNLAALDIAQVDHRIRWQSRSSRQGCG